MKRKVREQKFTISLKDLPPSLKLMFHCMNKAEKIEFFDHKIVVKIDTDEIINEFKEHLGVGGNYEKRDE